MDVFYINLAAQAERRRALEENFKAPANWRLTRIEAVTAGDMAGRIPGRISDGEKACFHSHIKALTLALQTPGPVLIAEDDIMFGSRSFAAIEQALAKIPENAWDIVFTDVSITNIHAMLDLMMARPQALGGGPFGIINLARMPFAGSAGYIVNAKAKEKLLALISGVSPMDFPYDIHLQRTIAEGKLAGFVTFPFTTTLSPEADRSQIRDKLKIHETAMNAFRRLMWLERDIADADKTIAQVTAGASDPEVQTFLKILSVFLEPGFKQ